MSLRVNGKLLRSARVHFIRGLLDVFALSHAFAWSISSHPTVGMFCGNVRDAVIPHYIIEKGGALGGGGRG